MTKRKKRLLILVIILIVLIAAVLFVIFGTRKSRTEQDTVNGSQIYYKDGEHSKVLVAYFSGADNMPQSDIDAKTSASVVSYNGENVGNTELVAMKIGEKVQGDLFSIQTKKLYSSNYTLSTIQALGEQKLNVKPKLVSNVENFDDYDVIYLGYPAWWMDVPIAIEEFLDEYDFSGKTVIPFTTHASSGLGGTPEKIQKLIPNADVKSGFAVQESDVDGDNLEKILNEELKK